VKWQNAERAAAATAVGGASGRAGTDRLTDRPAPNETRRDGMRWDEMGGLDEREDQPEGKREDV
jgi:hypothetical protein